ncbi:MAG: hypothetical protein NVS4B7_12980 [Ktedonobacteraceae bacterium]
MRFSNRSKVSIIISLGTIVTIMCAFMLNSLFLHVNAIHASSPNVAPSSVTKGSIKPVAIINPVPSSLPAANVIPSSTLPPPKGVRSIHSKGLVSRGPTATSTPFDAGQAGKLLRNFNGVSSRDSAITNFGAEFEPPDQGLCVGNGFVLEAVNSAYKIYRTDGSLVAGPFNVNVLFDEGLKQFTSDPRCYYDKSTNTWFAIILYINFNNPSARTDIAVSSSGDPTKPWTVYHLNATDNGTDGMPSHHGCPCFGDQPLLGIDSQNLYISTNEFSILGPQFDGAQIYALSKAQLVAQSRVNFVHFFDLSNGNAQAASVQPAITNGPAAAEYFLNSIDPTATSGNTLGVWALTNRDAVSQGDIPTLSRIVIASEPYAVPPPAIQKGSTSRLDSGDDRMMQVEYINGNLWGALGTALTIPRDTVVRAGIAWFKVDPRLDGDKIGSAVIDDQSYVASSGNYLLYPAIEVSPEGTAAIVMTLSGRNFFPSAAYTVMQEETMRFGSIHIAAYGTGPYDATATRWGDYSAAALSSDGNNFWMATEYIPPLSSQTPDRLRNWGTRVLEVSARA